MSAFTSEDIGDYRQFAGVLTTTRDFYVLIDDVLHCKDLNGNWIPYELVIQKHYDNSEEKQK